MSTSGAYLSAMIGSTQVELEDNNLWKVTESAKELDRTTGAAGGFGDVDSGVLRATITIHGWLDLATQTGGAYQSVSAGNVITNLKLYYDRSDPSDTAFVFPLAVVIDSDLGGEVDGQFEWNCTLKNKGSYTYGIP